MEFPILITPIRMDSEWYVCISSVRRGWENSVDKSDVNEFIDLMDYWHRDKNRI